MASSPVITASSSMRLLVVCLKPFEISLRWLLYISKTPNPPGPGLPREEPSVYILIVFKRYDVVLFASVKVHNWYVDERIATQR
jgi:hypothetical protein